MQYESYKKGKNSSFYIIVLICIVAVALVSYIAVAGSKGGKDKTDENNQKSEISSDSSAYNSSGNTGSSVTEPPIIENSQITENSVSKVPYESKPAEEKQSFVLPVKGNIIKGYSDTSLQYDKTYSDLRLHKGIDISCEDNAKIVAASKGTVTEINDSADYGKVITIDHGNGLIVKYCGLGSICVTKGETVGAGVLIGTAKNPPCECMDENHIHIECTKNGKDISPLDAFGF